MVLRGIDDVWLRRTVRVEVAVALRGQCQIVDLDLADEQVAVTSGTLAIVGEDDLDLVDRAVDLELEGDGGASELRQVARPCRRGNRDVCRDERAVDEEREGRVGGLGGYACGRRGCRSGRVKKSMP